MFHLFLLYSEALCRFEPFAFLKINYVQNLKPAVKYILLFPVQTLLEACPGVIGEKFYLLSDLYRKSLTSFSTDAQQAAHPQQDEGCRLGNEGVVNAVHITQGQAGLVQFQIG